jgi:membrane protein implicated in regulation of membrane protease activity
LTNAVFNGKIGETEVTDAFTNISALTVFLIIAGLGFVFLVVSLVFGELFDFLNIDHDIGGGADAHPFIDSRVISVFLTAFGGFGAIAVQMGLSALASSLVGLAGGLALGGVVSLFGRFLYKQQASSSVSAAQLVGRTAQVTVKITPDGIGQISCRIGEERVEKLARTRDREELKAGVLVRIEEIAGDSVIVTRDGVSVVPRA